MLKLVLKFVCELFLEETPPATLKLSPVVLRYWVLTPGIWLLLQPSPVYAAKGCEISLFNISSNFNDKFYI